MWATYKGKSATVTMLLGRGADVNAHGNFHISSLVWAAGRGYTDIVKDLIAHGTKVNVGDKVIVSGCTTIDDQCLILGIFMLIIFSVWHNGTYMGIAQGKHRNR